MVNSQWQDAVGPVYLIRPHGPWNLRTCELCLPLSHEQWLPVKPLLKAFVLLVKEKEQDLGYTCGRVGRQREEDRLKIRRKEQKKRALLTTKALGTVSLTSRQERFQG